MLISLIKNSHASGPVVSTRYIPPVWPPSIGRKERESRGGGREQNDSMLRLILKSVALGQPFKKCRGRYAESGLLMVPFLLTLEEHNGSAKKEGWRSGEHKCLVVLQSHDWILGRRDQTRRSRNWDRQGSHKHSAAFLCPCGSASSFPSLCT